MSATKISGVLIVKGDVQQVTEKFAKREFVIETTGEMYPQKVLIQLTQDGVGILDNFHVGDIVDVNINIRGREWTKPETGEIKYFNSLEAWTISLVGQTIQQPEKITPETLETKTEASDDDDLPF